MKKLILFLSVSLYTAAVFSQSITNTLGTSGSFIIKDGTANFLTLDQSTGQMNILKTLRLENTTGPDSGVIFKGTDRFIHNFGLSNTFMGINSGNFTMTGGYNAALGGLTLISNESGERNTAIGTAALYSNTSGSNNTAIGNGSLSSNTTGFENVALGNQSLGSNITGVQNTAFGFQALYNNTEAYGNTAAGYDALYHTETGVANSAFGYAAGYEITTGENLTCIGYNAEPSFGGAINQITLGDDQIVSLRCAVTNLTSLSDARDKKNITDLSLGLDFISKLKPRQFNWDKREWYLNNKSDGSKMKEESTAGFIAQELDEVQTTENAGWLNLVLKDNPEKWEATPGNLLPVIVKAIQDLKKENDELKVANDKLKANSIDLAGKLANFEMIQNMLVNEIEKLKTNNNDSAEFSLGTK